MLLPGVCAPEEVLAAGDPLQNPAMAPVPECPPGPGGSGPALVPACWITGANPVCHLSLDVCELQKAPEVKAKPPGFGRRAGYT